MRVLISAYACEPGRGSEPEVGWQWALHMARRHDVTVLTRANNEPVIRAGLAAVPEPERPKFLYLDLSPTALQLKKTLGAHRLYYDRWQRAAHAKIAEVARDFELLHHVTYAACRYEPAILGHGVPSVWGPVGGMEQIPAHLLPWRHPALLPHELLRNLGNARLTASGALARRARAATRVIASTRETQRALADAGITAPLMPTIALPVEKLSPRPPRPPGPLRVLFTGALQFLKGLHLGLEALARVPDARWTFIGDGPHRPALEAQARALGLGGRVDFRGKLPRADVLRAYADFDVFLFPSLHDSGGFSVLEAMAAGLPVVCLDCGGPAVAVTPECGIAVPVGSREEIVAGLTAALTRYADAGLRDAHGSAAHARVAAEYNWESHAVKMDAIYREALA